MNTLVDPAVMIPAIRDQVQAVADDMPLVKIVPDQELQDFESREERSLASLLAGFSALAFGLAILGLCGTVAYSVSQRMREMAIRFALGVTRRGVLWMILSEAMRYVLVGILLGWALAGSASRTVESFLFEVRGFDPVACAWSIGLMTVTALLAAYVPARRGGGSSRWPCYEASSRNRVRDIDSTVANMTTRS